MMHRRTAKCENPSEENIPSLFHLNFGMFNESEGCFLFFSRQERSCPFFLFPLDRMSVSLTSLHFFIPFSSGCLTYLHNRELQRRQRAAPVVIPASVSRSFIMSADDRCRYSSVLPLRLRSMRPDLAPDAGNGPHL